MIKRYIAGIILWAHWKFLEYKRKILVSRYLKIGKWFDDSKEYGPDLIIHGSFSQEQKDKRIELNKKLATYDTTESKKEQLHIRKTYKESLSGKSGEPE